MVGYPSDRLASCLQLYAMYCVFLMTGRQWTSFLAGASTAGYVYMYSFYYYFFKTKSVNTAVLTCLCSDS